MSLLDHETGTPDPSEFSAPLATEHAAPPPGRRRLSKEDSTLVVDVDMVGVEDPVILHTLTQRTAPSLGCDEIRLEAAGADPMTISVERLDDISHSSLYESGGRCLEATEELPGSDDGAEAVKLIRRVDREFPSDDQDHAGQLAA